jgi:hypothetical protein
VDTESSAFVSLVHYVVTNEVPSILSQGGHQLVVHTVVAGGQALVDTLHGAAQLVKQLEDARSLSGSTHFGTGCSRRKNVRTDEDVSGHQKADRNGRKPAGVHRRTISQDIALMLNSRLTFKEAIQSPDQSLMSRHRLKVAQRELCSRLESLIV